MALFGKKDPCAICGGKVKGLLPWRIEGQYICNDCYGNTDLPQDMVNHMTLEDFRGYMAFREENDLLRQQFCLTHQVDFGWLDDKFLFDFSNRLLCMDKHLNKTIFEGRQIRSFVIREDSTPLFEGSAAGLVCYPSTVPDRVMAMAPQINHMRMQEQMQRNAERAMDMMDGKRDYDVHLDRPYRDLPEPFQKFVVEICFDHPYWQFYTADRKGPTFNNSMPDVNDYLRDYQNSAAIMGDLARGLMEVAFPGAPIQQMAAASVSPIIGATAVTRQGAVTPHLNVDAVTEIQRFKTLLDQGIITEEEFAAKKRQLLGI